MSDPRLDTGAIMADRANARIAREEEESERWQKSHQCMDCEWCDTNYGGWCNLEEVELDQDELLQTIWEAGCFQ